MKMNLITIAVVGAFSGMAMAESNVTIYGTADAGFSSWTSKSAWTSADRTDPANKTRRAHTTGVSSSGMEDSVLGFQGEENLGNGLKAVFQLETDISLDGRENWGSTSQSNVGLIGGFGELRFGLQSTFSDLWHGDAGAENMGNLSARNVAGGVKGSFSNDSLTGVTYISPEFEGLKFGLGVFFEDEGGEKNRVAASLDPLNPNPKEGKWTDGRETIYQLGANYENGAFKLAATAAIAKHDVFKNKREYTLATSYDFGPVVLLAGYERASNVDRSEIAGYADVTGRLVTNAMVGNGNRKDSNSLYTIGFSVPVGEIGAVNLGYARQKNDVSDSDAKAYMLGYEHKFSKRTSLYAAYMHLKNEKYGDTMPDERYQKGNASFLPDDASIYGGKYTGVTLGLKHSF